VYHTTGRWLRRAKATQRFIALNDKLARFLQTKRRAFPEREDSSWNDNLFFLCDITSTWNDLKSKLQGKANFWPPTCDKLCQDKAKIFQKVTFKGIMVHFLTYSLKINVQIISWNITVSNFENKNSFIRECLRFILLLRNTHCIALSRLQNVLRFLNNGEI